MQRNLILAVQLKQKSWCNQSDLLDINAHTQLKVSSMKTSRFPLALAIAAAMALAAGAAMAGSDPTFGTTGGATGGSGPVGTLSGWLEGSMGRLFAIGSLAVGLGVGIVQQSIMSVAVGTGIALAASAGPTVLSSMFSAVI